MPSTIDRLLMPTIDFEKIPVKDMRPPPTSKQNISFLQLPRELRDFIYRDSIAAGHVAILRLNKFTNEEASQLLPKHGSFRINLGYVNRSNWSKLRSASVIPVVQHVDLRIKACSTALPFNITVISGLLDKQAIRESCIVTLDYGKEGGPNDCIRETLYRHLARLGGFKKLVFRIVIEKYEPADFEGLISEKSFHEIFHYDTHLLGYHEDSYMELQKFMEPSLGPAKFDDSVEEHCLEFHPLEPLPVEDWYPRNPWIYDEDDEDDEEDEEDEDDEDDEGDEDDEDDEEDEDDD